VCWEPAKPIEVKTATSLCLVLATAVVVAGCGGGRKTSATSAVFSSTAAAGEVGTTQTAATATESPQSEAEGTTTRTAEGPAFLGESHSDDELQQAERVVEGAGYLPAETAGYRPQDALRVIIGRRTVGGLPAYQAFFFLDNRYLGTDAGQPSQSLAFVSATESSVALSYGIYAPEDQPCCPASRQTVTFVLNDGALAPQQPIPPVAERR